MQCTKANGYTIIEISIVLTIIALLTTSVYSLRGGKDDITKRRQTLQKMEIIEQAIAKYAAENGAIPCASNNHVALTNTAAGTAACGGVDYSYLVVATPTGYSGLTPWVVGSGVPFSTLGLPAEAALDGWGNRIEYIHASPLSLRAATYYLKNTNMGLLIIQDITGTVITNQAAYVLISHGANGFSARNSYGSTTTASTDANELLNAKTGAPVTPVFVASEPTATFDDIVHYKMKWQIVKEAGKVISNPVCTTASIVLTAQDVTVSGVVYNKYCKDSPGSSNCPNDINSMATKINALCLNPSNTN
jgi:prepilin-type N-terminal cleavage/methylation domain-containing protein